MMRLLKIISLLFIVAVLIIPVKAEGENENPGDQNGNGSLKIDTELNSTSNSQKSSYVEETDLYNLFVPETDNKVRMIQQEEVSKYKQEKESIFQQKNTSGKNEQEYRSLLFQANQAIKNSEGDTIHLEAPKKQISIITIVLGLMGLIVMALSASVTLKKRREQDE